jgi:hypothetical protein
MSESELVSERARFNSLSPESAKAILEQMKGQQSVARSCWYCNGSHEHLKTAEFPIVCAWGCGVYYLQGYPGFVVMTRAIDVPITDGQMQDWIKALEESDDE